MRGKRRFRTLILDETPPPPAHAHVAKIADQRPGHPHEAGGSVSASPPLRSEGW